MLAGSSDVTGTLGEWWRFYRGTSAAITPLPPASHRNVPSLLLSTICAIASCHLPSRPTFLSYRAICVSFVPPAIPWVQSWHWVDESVIMIKANYLVMFWCVINRNKTRNLSCAQHFQGSLGSEYRSSGSSNRGHNRLGWEATWEVSPTIWSPLVWVEQS